MRKCKLVKLHCCSVRLWKTITSSKRPLGLPVQRVSLEPLITFFATRHSHLTRRLKNLESSTACSLPASGDSWTDFAALHAHQWKFVYQEAGAWLLRSCQSRRATHLPATCPHPIVALPNSGVAQSPSIAATMTLISPKLDTRSISRDHGAGEDLE